MEFLGRHFEKLLLGLALLGLLVSAYFLLRSLKTAGEDVRLVQLRASKAVTEGQRLGTLSENEFKPAAAMLGDATDLYITGETGTGSLMAPPKYIRCVNLECMYLLPFGSEACPFCGAEEPPVEEEKIVLKGDSDGDGMPDAYEAERPFLDRTNAADASDDHDRDGFTNIEEFTAETDPADPADFPPLARNLRYLSIFRKPIPIVLRRVNVNNPEDEKTWDISCEVTDGRKTRSRIFRLGDTAVGYQIVAVKHAVKEVINAAMNVKMKDDASQLTVRSTTTGDTYVLDSGKSAYEKDVFVRLIYLANRYNPRACPQSIGKLGYRFNLPHSSGVAQEYVVSELTRNSVQVKRLSEDGGQQAKQTVFDIEKLNPAADFLRRRENEFMRQP